MGAVVLSAMRAFAVGHQTGQVEEGITLHHELRDDAARAGEAQCQYRPLEYIWAVGSDAE